MYKLLNILFKKYTAKNFFYSYSGIDILIDTIFKNQKKGFYVDVGCSHPIKNNNTYLLHRRGWCGTNIDLDLQNIKLFDYARPKDNNVNSAISDKASEENLYFYHNKSPINTLSQELSSYQKAKVSKIIKVKTVKLNTILENSPFFKHSIDFMSIDVEGLEFKILKYFDFAKYKPKVIVVEFLDTELPKLEIKNLNITNVLKSDIYKLLISKNYTLANWLHSDLVFVSKDFKD